MFFCIELGLRSSRRGDGEREWLLCLSFFWEDWEQELELSVFLGAFFYLLLIIIYGQVMDLYVIF